MYLDMPTKTLHFVFGANANAPREHEDKTRSVTSQLVSAKDKLDRLKEAKDTGNNYIHHRRFPGRFPGPLAPPDGARMGPPRPITSGTLALAHCMVGLCHCRPADRQNSNSCNGGTPSHCWGNGSNCSAHTTTDSCVHTAGTPSLLPAFCVEVGRGSQYVSSSGMSGC